MNVLKWLYIEIFYMSTIQSNNLIDAALTELGLRSQEAKLYQLLLNTPDATIAVLQKRGPFNRTMLYYLIHQLEEWGLVSTKRVGKKTIYVAAPPERLYVIAQEQELEIQRRKNLVGNVMDDLRVLYRIAHHQSGVRFFEGKKGFYEALYETFRATETVRTYVDFDAVAKYVPDINERYEKDCSRRHVDKRHLVRDTPSNRKYVREHPSEFTEVRFLPDTLMAFRIGVQMYDNKIAYFTMRDENIMAVIIDDPDIYEMHRHIFDFLWEMQIPRNKKTLA